MVFLQSHGVGTARAVRIYKTYGADAIPLVKEDPYRLARDIRGIGFRTADQLAARLGIPKESMLRARAGISYALMEAVANGDCGLPQDDLLALAAKLLEIGGAILAEALRLEIASGGVVEMPSTAGRPCSCRISTGRRRRSPPRSATSAPARRPGRRSTRRRRSPGRRRDSA